MMLAVTGLAREARIIARPNMMIVAGGGDREVLEARIQSALDAGAQRILSIGICGALSPALRVTDCIVATEIVCGTERWPTDPGWTHALLVQVPNAKPAIVAGSDTIVADEAARKRLHEGTGAVAADMESHIAARAALQHRLPFAAFRVVSDSSRQSLPPAALVAMLPSGKVDLGAVLRSIASKPAQIPALIRTAWEAERAFRMLRGCRHVLEAEV